MSTMTASRKFVAFALAFLMTSLLGCASTAQHEGTGEYFDDSVITAKVKSAIFKEPSLKSAEINVETFKGIVQLSGFVRSDDEIARAGEVARDVEGVKSVSNDMHVK
jgi:osmotically-inducible protein OsmY